MEIYRVGGSVRDELLGLEPAERDWVVVGAEADDLEAAGYRRVGRDFPVFLHPETHEEYALARTERKTGPGYRGFAIDAGPAVTLSEDLARRDLTINAMARSPADGELIDPWGGQRDLQARLLRHVSPAFTEDPLRVLRVARFAARLAPLGFRVADETRTLMRSLAASGELDWLVAERVWRETARALSEAHPRAYFDELAACGALPVVLPELAPLFAPDADPLPAAALDEAARLVGEPMVRLAALCHDLDPDGALGALGRRLPIPREWSRLLVATARGAPLALDRETPDAKALERLLALTDGLRRPERFEAALSAWEAIALARSHPVWPARRECLRRARAAAGAISGAPLAAAGWQGAALGVELARRRREAIAAAITSA